MQQITIPGTRLQASRFIFGTASLFNVGSRRKRHSLLAAALEAGFTHFDTAPYYGFGCAERDLGAVFAVKSRVTFTTKVGIYSAGGEQQPQWSVLLRKAGGRVLPALSRPTVDFALARAKQALTNSLQRLGRQRVEAYLLHEPEVHMLQTDEWQRWLQDEVQAGRVGTFGLALTAERLAPFLQRAPELTPLVQVLDSLERREADLLASHGRPLQITYGYVSAARAAGSTLSVSQILKAALKRNAHGSVIVSTTRPERVGQYAALLAGQA